ncbi:MAG: hypothetical protein ACR2J3_12360 [Aridibacter sp.]
MKNLKNLCFLFILSWTFIDCSSAQDKKPIDLSPKPNAEANKFESKEGNFSINISQSPFMTRNVGSELVDKKGINTGKQFGWKLEKISYTAMYSLEDISNEDSMAQLFSAMNIGVRKGILNQGFKLISEKEISYGKHPGREFHSISSNGVNFITRNYLINDMGYQISGIYVDEKDEKEVLEVLDSFRLLNDKK